MVALFTAAALPFAHDGWEDHMDWGAGWWIVMAVGMVIFWGLVIAGIVWLARSLPWRPVGHHDGGSALDLLDRRFAAGEMSVDEYRERRAILKGEEPPPQV